MGNELNIGAFVQGDGFLIASETFILAHGKSAGITLPIADTPKGRQFFTIGLGIVISDEFHPRIEYKFDTRQPAIASLYLSIKSNGAASVATSTPLQFSVGDKRINLFVAAQAVNAIYVVTITVYG